MRCSAAIMFTAGLVWSGQTAAQETTIPWSWVAAISAANGWFVNQGDAVVEISAGKIHALLNDTDIPNSARYELVGTLSLEQTDAPVTRRECEDRSNFSPEQLEKSDEEAEGDYTEIQGTVSVVKKTLNSDAWPMTLDGTYRKIVYGQRAACIYGIQYREVIQAVDGFNMVGLTRMVK